MLQQQTNLVRIGILAMSLVGLLALFGLVANYDVPDPRTDPRGAAQVLSSTGYFVSQFVGNILGFTLLIFGVLALTAYLANTRVKGLALGAMALSIVGIALILSVSGVAAYALPGIARDYLNGQQDLVDLSGEPGARGMVVAILGSPAREIFVLVFFLYSAGFILFGVAVWRSGVLRKGTAIPLAFHAPLFSSFIKPHPDWASVFGGATVCPGKQFYSSGCVSGIFLQGRNRRGVAYRMLLKRGHPRVAGGGTSQVLTSSAGTLSSRGGCPWSSPSPPASQRRPHARGGSSRRSS
jgi:hypothetical protein